MLQVIRGTNPFDRITFGVDEDRRLLLSRGMVPVKPPADIIDGKDTFDNGNYYINRDIKIGYLEQDPQFDPALTLFQAVYGASGELMETCGIMSWPCIIMTRESWKQPPLKWISTMHGL